MGKLLGFIPNILGLLSNGLTSADKGVKTLSKMASDNPKKSGVFGVMAGWLGIDPDPFIVTAHSIGRLLGEFSGWLMAL